MCLQQVELSPNYFFNSTEDYEKRRDVCRKLLITFQFHILITLITAPPQAYMYVHV